MKNLEVLCKSKRLFADFQGSPSGPKMDSKVSPTLFFANSGKWGRSKICSLLVFLAESRIFRHDVKLRDN